MQVIHEFQFQNGAIKRKTEILTDMKKISFNSKMVRLRAACNSVNCKNSCVSIPKWCD